MGGLFRRRTRAATLAFLAVAASLPAQERPINPDELESGSRGLPLQISGFAVGQYDYSAATGENTYVGSVLAVSVFKAVSDRLSFFGQVTVSREGPGPFASDSEEPASYETAIDNLQVAWAAAPSRGLTLVFGKFDSPLAIERDDAPLNFLATSSFVFQFARPVKFTGLMARQTFSPELEGYAILANGWDVDRDNNRAKTGALYGVWSPWPIAHVGVGLIHGAEKDDRTGDRRTAGIATILIQQTDHWVWGEEFAYGSEPHSAPDGGTASWFGDMFFTHHRLGRHWAVSLRTDYFDDRQGARTGRRQILRSFTVSPQYLVGGGFFGPYRTLDRTSLKIPELTVRLDLRYDRSTEPVFAGRDEKMRRDGASAALQVVYVF